MMNRHFTRRYEGSMNTKSLDRMSEEASGVFKMNFEYVHLQPMADRRRHAAMARLVPVPIASSRRPYAEATTCRQNRSDVVPPQTLHAVGNSRSGSVAASDLLSSPRSL